MTHSPSRIFMIAAAFGVSASAAQADFVINDDLIVDGSACIGFDCVNGESFGFDTIRMKENNLRIKADDTSVAGSYPSTDWTLLFNDSANGGLNRFSVQDNTANRIPFTVEGNAPNNALYVDDGGRVGLGTSTPSVELHAVEGDTPTLRLQQDGSSGFGAQTWDLAGNETNFFIRDVSNGSTLPFRIRPGAPTSAIDINGDGDVGIGTASPDAPLEIQRSDDFVFFRLTATGGTLANDSADVTYTAGPANTGELRYNIVDADGFEMSLNADGDLTITGELTTSGSCSVGCDRVFTAEYDLPSIEEHHAAMWENGYLPNVGPTIEGQPFNVSDKLARVLNELEHAHIFIDRQQDMINDLRALQAEQNASHAAELAALKLRLTAIEAQ